MVLAGNIVFGELILIDIVGHFTLRKVQKFHFDTRQIRDTQPENARTFSSCVDIMMRMTKRNVSRL